MSEKFAKRAIVSFSGICPMNCKHCYTFELDKEGEDQIDNIIGTIGNRSFDIIYVSQSYENFFDGKKGTMLCTDLYNKYKKDIVIITRSYLDDEIIEILYDLNETMKINGHQLYLMVSFSAKKSYGVTEDVDICPSPKLRISNLERAFNKGIKTALLLRPLFPNNIIPILESINIIEETKPFINAVISSGLILTDKILDRLGLNKNDFNYLETGDSEYLKDLDKENVKYVDVEREIHIVQAYCELIRMPFFMHTMPAINYLSIAPSL